MSTARWRTLRPCATWSPDQGRHGFQGIVASTAALSVLLREGIGDTIRISLTPGRRRPHAGGASARRSCGRWGCVPSCRW